MSLYIPEVIVDIILTYYHELIHTEGMEQIVCEMQMCFNPIQTIGYEYIYLDNNFVDRWRRKQYAFSFPRNIDQNLVFDHLDTVNRIKDSFNAILYNKYITKGGKYTYTFWRSNIK